MDEEFLEAVIKADELHVSSQLPPPSAPATISSPSMQLQTAGKRKKMDSSNSLLVTAKPISPTYDSDKDVEIDRLKKELQRVSKRLLDLEEECCQLREWKKKETHNSKNPNPKGSSSLGMYRRPIDPTGSELPHIPYPKECFRFYDRLYELVDDPSSDSIISWSKSNTGFIIWNQKELSRGKMLWKFYCTSFTELISEIIIHGFNEIKGSAGQWEFGDKNFVRGRPELMDEMRKQSLLRSRRKLFDEMKGREQVEKRFNEIKAREKVKERFNTLQI